jgi:hypothetical protein
VISIAVLEENRLDDEIETAGGEQHAVCLTLPNR